MNFLITGGNRGLGKHLAKVFNADSLNRSNGFDITKDIDSIVEKSLQYDVFINNAFDGPPHENWACFAQSNLYFALYDAWKSADKSGYIFNIGSVGANTIVPAEPRFETYRVSKSALAHASQQGSQSFKQNLVKFRTTLITPDRLDTDLSRSRDNWTGNGVSLDDVTNFIKFALTCDPNTVIDQIGFYCNLNYHK